MRTRAEAFTQRDDAGTKPSDKEICDHVENVQKLTLEGNILNAIMEYVNTMKHSKITIVSGSTDASSAASSMEHDDTSNQMNTTTQTAVPKEPLGASKSTSSNWGAIDDETA